MRIIKDFLNRLYGDVDSVTSETLQHDETRTISEELKSTDVDHKTIEQGILVSLAGTSGCNGLYVRAGILSGKPYYVFNNYRIIWSASNYRWELQQITPNIVMYYNDTSDDLTQPFYDLNWTVSSGTAPVPIFSNNKDTIKIKNINFIIDDDDESIDGSNTPSIDPHSELPTLAKLNSAIIDVAHWDKTGTHLNPLDINVDVIDLQRDHNGYTQLKIRNDNTAGNGSGALLELKGSGADYTNNAYFGIYSPNFWLPQLANNAVLMTDKKLVMGTVDNTESIEFLIGDSYSSPNVVAHLNTDGFHLDTLQTTSVHPPSYYNLFVNASTGLMYASNTGATGNTPHTDTYVLTATDISNNYVDLSNNPTSDNHNTVNLNGLVLFEGVGEDYTITTNRVSFTGVDLIVGDRLQIKYKY